MPTNVLGTWLAGQNSQSCGFGNMFKTDIRRGQTVSIILYLGQINRMANDGLVKVLLDIGLEILETIGADGRLAQTLKQETY